MALYNGVNMTFKQMEELTGVDRRLLHKRYSKGYRDEDLVCETTFKPITVEYCGKVVTLKELADLTGIGYNRLTRRYREGLRGKELYRKANGNKGKSVGIKLTPNTVAEIYHQLIYGKLTQAELADIYGVHQSTISDINRGKRWGNLTKELKAKWFS